MVRNPEGETGQQAYDSEFLKLLASPPPKPLAPELAPGWRRVAQESPRSTMSSFLTPKNAVTNPRSANYEVTLDVSSQVLRLVVPIEYGYDNPEAPGATLLPSLSETEVNASKFAPAAALALKAKQFDDGLYASVGLAADTGVGRFRGGRDLLLRLLQALVTENDCTAASILTAAARLSGQHPKVSVEVAQQAEVLLANELRSRVLGFYTWSEELSRVFRRDRMLQTEIKEPTARAFATALSRNEELLAAYDSHLRLAEKLTNPLAWDDLRELVVALKEGRIPIFPMRMSLFPPSRAHETDLTIRLFEDRPIPEGFDLADEMIKRLRVGDLDPTPTPTSGWYDHQTYALEALVVPERMPEAKHVSYDISYCEELVGLFKALLALTRETHIKQSLLDMVVGATVSAHPSKKQLFVSPGLTLEPLATYYLRRARSYRFVHGVLEQAFGAKGLAEMQRLTADGPVNLSLGEELRMMQAIFHGAYLQVCGEIGMTPEEDSNLRNPKDASGYREALGAWLASVRKDPDLGNDIRMMVPIFYDLARKKTKVWAVLGIATKPLTVSYVTPPAIKEIKGPDGKLLKPSAVEVKFISDFHETAYFATAEIYVTRLLDRTEFRKHCDRHKTYKAIISSLE